MKISAFAVHETNGWPELGTDALAAGVNVFFGASATGKSTLADLTTHALYGQRLTSDDRVSPEGEVVVKSRGKHYRLRRSYDAAAGERLTVAALDKSPVDEATVHGLVACLPPSLLQPLFSVSFRESPRLDWLLSPEFSHEFRAALWRLKWAPPTVQDDLRPLYARLRALETEVKALTRKLGGESQAPEAAPVRRRDRRRRASQFLAALTQGELVRLRLGDEAGQAKASEAMVVTRSGDVLPVESLWSTQRDQVYLSLCLALVSALHRHGVRLPLVLDEPFARLDARSAAAAIEVLDEFAAHGHQLLIFTSSREAADRFAALDAQVIEMHDLARPAAQRSAAERPAKTRPEAATDSPELLTRRVRRRVKTTRMQHREAG